MTFFRHSLDIYRFSPLFSTLSHLQSYNYNYTIHLLQRQMTFYNYRNCDQLHVKICPAGTMRLAFKLRFINFEFTITICIQSIYLTHPLILTWHRTDQILIQLARLVSLCIIYVVPRISETRIYYVVIHTTPACMGLLSFPGFFSCSAEFCFYEAGEFPGDFPW